MSNHFVNIGALYNTRQEIDAAIRQLDAALRIDPTKVEALYNRGKAFTSLGISMPPSMRINKRFRYNPDFTAARINLGSLFFSRNEYDRAAEQFES